MKGILNRQNPMLILIGKISMTLANGLVLVILARFSGAEAVGIYTLALALVSPIFLFAGLRLQDRVATDPRIAERWSRYRGSLVIGIAFGLVVATIVALLYPRPELLGVVLALSISKSVEAYAFAIHGYWRGIGRFDLVARANLVRSAALVLGISVGWLIFANVVGAAALAAALSAVLLPILERPTPPAREATAGTSLRMFWHLVPLGSVSVAIALNESIVRVTIERNVGISALGVFATTAYLVRGLTIVAQTFGQAQSPAIRDAISQNDRERVARLGLKSAGQATVFALCVACGLVLVGPQILSWLFGPDMQVGRVLIGSIMLAGIPLSAATALAVATVAMDRHSRYFLAVLGSLIGTLIMVSTLTPEYGVFGAALGWATGEVVKATILVAIALRYSKSSIESDGE